MKIFWIIWSPTGSSPPRVLHPCEGEALRIADQMAARHPGALQPAGVLLDRLEPREEEVPF